MKLNRFCIPKSALVALPENERRLLIIFGHFANEINILNKLLLWSIDDSKADGIEKQAWQSRAMLLFRILGGKLHEGRVLLGKVFFGTSISKQYESDLPDVSKEAFANIKRYFGKDTNILSSMRNNHAFHYPFGKLEAAVDLLTDDDTFDLYLADQTGNCFYHGSDLLAGLAVTQDIQGTDLEARLSTFVTDVSKVTGWFLRFINGCFLLIAERHSLDKYLDPKDEIEIVNPPQLDKVTIPFFTIQ